VENLLDATRLESGLLQPVREWCDPGEILREAMQQVAFENHPLQLSIADSLPHVSIDARLMIQALTAILTNATIYSPPNEPIEAAVHVDGRSIVFTVADHGAGLQQGEEGQSVREILSRSGQTARRPRARTLDRTPISRSAWRCYHRAKSPGGRSAIYDSVADRQANAVTTRGRRLKISNTLPE
jgi:signal transduction histidine kinase